MDTPAASAEEALSFNQVLEQVRQDYERTQKALKEVDILLQQSSVEVEKLAQRNSQVVNKLRQTEAVLETVPRKDLKDLYTLAQETQMRLFTMRGQVEQLQGKQQLLEQHAARLRQVLDVAGQFDSSDASGSGERPGENSGIVRVINAQESERQRLARQMHDGPAQSLTNLILQAEICERLIDQDPSRARTELANLKEAVNRTFQQVREFIFDLRPMMLDDLGLIPTLKRYVRDFQTKNSLTCNLTVTGKEQRLPPHTEVTAFRVVQGLLYNVRQHANASQVDIALGLGPDGLKVSLEDDGTGFDLARVVAEHPQPKASGIVTMMEQVEMLGGHLHFDTSPGQGTKVQLRLPT